MQKSTSRFEDESVNFSIGLFAFNIFVIFSKFLGAWSAKRSSNDAAVSCVFEAVRNTTVLTRLNKFADKNISGAGWGLVPRNLFNLVNTVLSTNV